MQYAQLPRGCGKTRMLEVMVENYIKQEELVMTEFNQLIGKSVTGLIYEGEHTAYLTISDGSKLEVACNPYPDCCGYNSFDVVVPDGFDFTDNVITKIEDNSDEDGYDCAGTISLGIFTNDSKINVEGEYGSGSGWGYGQYVCIEIIGGQV